MSLRYLKEAVANNENEKLIRYVRLHLGDGNEAAGRKEIDKAWVEALKLLLDVPPTDREFILGTLNNGLTLLDVSSFWQDVTRGVVLMLAVSLDQIRTRALGD